MKKYMKKNWKKILSILFLLLGIITLSIYYYKSTHSVMKDFSKINLDHVNKLMIVAHPDDEILWGGAHLIEDDYLVVCITCGTKQVRVNEFVRVMNRTHDKYIMLGYPDKTNGERDNWDNDREAIIKDLTEIIGLKDWEIIVTHNPDGEYGHIHHKMSSAIVTEITDTSDNLYYFGRYYSKKNITNHYEEMVPINDKYLSQKKNIIGLYKSQSFIQTMFDHMYPYEEWVQAKEWSVNE